jgi:hypothetical protein
MIPNACHVTLQDPSTASMGAGIDRKVLQSHPRLDPGAVLVLDQVSPPHIPEMSQDFTFIYVKLTLSFSVILISCRCHI